MINFNEWKKFRIARLFSIKSPSKRSIKSYSQGTVPYVSSGGINNGVVSYLDPKENEQLEKGNCITVSPLEGTASFYQETDFLGRGGGGSAISLLYNEHLNKYNALFVCTIIEICAKKFNYNDAFNSDNLKTLEIPLPAKKNDDDSYFIDSNQYYNDEGFVPDWDFMSNYMKLIEEKAQSRIDILSRFSID